MNKHLEPWQVSADDFPADSFASDQLEFLLRYALLAPSPHNTQPWLFRINAMDVEIFADWRRLLRVVDPHGRQLSMSAGAALLNLRVAAEYFGHAYKVQLRPGPANRDLLARFQLGLQGETRGEDIQLFYAITQRRTNRQAFTNQPIPEEVLNSLESAAREYGAWFQVVREENARLAMADLVAEGDRKQWANKQFRAELAHWTRAHPEERGDGLPVTQLGIKNWLSFAGPLYIRTFDRGGGMAAMDRDIALHSPVLAVLSTERDDPSAWLSAGQALQRVLLEARSDEIWASFLNQPIEVPELRAQLAEICGGAVYPQIMLRLGYGPEVAPSPRRSLRNLLIMHKSAHPSG